MKRVEQYNPFTTAIKREHLSKPTRELLNRGLLHGDILDYGCGRGADVKWVKEDFKLDIWGYDKYNDAFNKPYLLEETYDCVICNYVFNVIPSIKEHNETLKLIRSIGKEVYICVRVDVSSVKENWIWSSKEQGYWTPKKTFQRFYDSDSIEFLFGNVEYIINRSDMKLFKLKKMENKEMRELTTVQTKEKLNKVYATDEKGSGGANHEYVIVCDTNTDKSVKIVIKHQNGARHEDNPKNGILDCDLLEIVRDRLTSFQAGEFASQENAQALLCVEGALQWMNKRVEDRIARNVLGKEQK